MNKLNVDVKEMIEKQFNQGERKMKTTYTVVMKPILPDRDFYTIDKVKQLCQTKSKLWAWVVFIKAGWFLPKDHDIQIITMRPE